MNDGLTARLADLAARHESTSYGALARDLGLRMGELTAALEALMEEDAALGRPFRAVVVSARGSALPARGFFDKAAELGRPAADQTAYVVAERLALSQP
ncbi:hypothetical protein MASR2M74_15350 [Paracoccaceae bacterium]